MTTIGRRRALERARRHFLPEIQALRMWAVGLVVLFHLWPAGWLRGGFVGVDAFFVISGYLITSHLLREVEATGRVRLAAFYARRARRLLPASLLVLVVSAALTLGFLPQDTWAPVSQEILASTAYVQNLWLASRAVTYSASTEAASAVQHYWSLSTEEQFYLVWPSLILLALAISRRWAPRRPVATVGVVLTVTALASLLASVLWTANDPAAAYFVTPTRAWEFAAGAVLPLVLRVWAPPGPFSVILRYLGLGMLVISAVVLSQQSAFPGWVALWPVVGTALVILAGDCAGQDRLDALWTNRGAQWLGNISYSIYLWHWPLIVAAPYLTGGHLRIRHKLAIIALTLALSHLSKRYVEDATAYLPRVRRSTRRSLLAALSAMLVVAAIGVGLTGASAWADHRREATLQAAAGDSCAGGRAGIRLASCPDAFSRKPVVGIGPGDTPWKHVDGCNEVHDPYMECGWGDRSRTIALVGDSHAEHLAAAVHDLARRNGWRVLVFVKQRCPAADADIPQFLGRNRKDATECRTWVPRVTSAMKEHGVSLVVTSAYAVQSVVPGGQAAADRAYHRVWDEWSDFAQVAVVRDVPQTGERDMPACVKQHADDLRACSLPRSRALVEDQMLHAARSTRNAAVHLVDLSDAYCDLQTCYGVAGGLPVYMDRNHIAYGFMQTLGPVLESQLPK